jgi:hypothetical protein
VTSTAIALPVPPLPNPEVLAPAPDSVAELDRELRAAATAYRKTLARIAYHGFRLRLCEGWTLFGFPSGTEGENRYREDVLHIPRSSYFKAVRIGQALHQLSLEELESIRPTNLELLLQVSPTLWHDFAWVREAKILKPARLAELIVERNQAIGEHTEPLTTFTAKVPYLAKQAMETMLEEFRRTNELSSIGQALELLIADRHDRSDLLTAAGRASQMIAGVIRSLDNMGRIDSEAREWLKLSREVLDEAREKEIQATRQKPARGEAAGGRA